MEVIFLDFDGVVNNFKEWHKEEGGVEFKKSNFSKSNILPLIALLTKCKKEKVKVIISSAWNIAGTKHCITELNRVVNNLPLLNEVIIGSTPYWYDEEVKVMSKWIGFDFNELNNKNEYEYFPTRGVEITAMLKLMNIDNYVMIDDCENFIKSQRDRWIETDVNVGLTMELVEETFNRLAKFRKEVSDDR